VQAVTVAAAMLLCACTDQQSPTSQGGASAIEEAKPANSAELQQQRQLVKSRSRALEVEQLEALGYVEGTDDPESGLSDVVIHVEGKTNGGYNFYNSHGDRGAQLIDMDGRMVHEWRTRSPGEWLHAELLPNGDVLVVVKDERLSRYDKDSKLLWSVNGRFHHDLWIHGDEIYAIARVARKTDYIHREAQTLVDVIRVLSLDGELRREISVLEAIHGSPYDFLLPSVAQETVEEGRQLDVLHTNHVEVFDGQLADHNENFAAGNILVSMRNINAIAILDGRTSKLVWIWGPTNITFQHHPTLLDNGHVLLFDNGVKSSRVIEIDPASGEIVWEYDPREGALHSLTRGGNQRLPNGNTLITESNRGYVLEVTPSGEVVWKFANPKFTQKTRRTAIWRMTRVDPKAIDFLD